MKGCRWTAPTAHSSNILSVHGLPGCVLAVWLLVFHKQWKHPEFDQFLLSLILTSLRFTVKVIMNGRLVSFSCKSYPKSPVVLQSKRMSIWCLEHAWKVKAERTSMRLWLCVQAGFEWCIMSVATLPDPDSHKFNVHSSGWTLLPMLSKKEGCGLWPHIFPPGLESRHPFCSCLCALYGSCRFQLSLQHSLDQPHEHCRYRALIETGGNALNQMA